jgi:mevalonate kinase
MPELTFEASGALLLCGAYALLEPGGMGVALPWPPRVQVSTREADHWRLTVTDSHGRRQDHVSALAEVAEGALPELRPQEITLNFGAHPATSTSAILALALAREANPIEPWGDEAFAQRSALTLHRTLQGGLGSGYDVLIANLRLPALLERPRTERAFPDPDPLGHRVLKPAHTPPILVAQHSTRVPTRHLLRTYRANRTRASEKIAELVAGSRAIAPEVARAIKEGDLALLRAAFADLPPLQETLQTLLDGHYINEAGRVGLQTARDRGIAATPSGASADTLVALDDDPEKLERLASRWTELGFHTTQLGDAEPPAEGARD